MSHLAIDKIVGIGDKTLGKLKKITKVLKYVTRQRRSYWEIINSSQFIYIADQRYIGHPV